MAKNYMKGLKRQADPTKPCRCGTGYYCHRHWAYGLCDGISPDHEVTKVGRGRPRSKVGARAESMGGQH